MGEHAEADERPMSVGRIVLASLVGTTIEFYDFYIYGAAAALVIGQTFFPKSSPETQALNAFLTFGIAFLARPVGSMLFGHFGDRIGRKSTLVASMLVMGLSTTLVGVLPGYAQAGVLAPWLLCLLRFGQGIGLGRRMGRRRAARDGERAGGATRVVRHVSAARSADRLLHRQRRCSWRCCSALGEATFVAWAWRVPFLLSAVLVAIGLYMRVSITETPAFRAAMARGRARRGAAPRSAARPLAAADAGLARDRRLLRAVLHFDGFRARLRRHEAAHSAHDVSGDALRRRRLSWRWRRRSRPRSRTASAAGRCCSPPARIAAFVGFALPALLAAANGRRCSSCASRWA